MANANVPILIEAAARAARRAHAPYSRYRVGAALQLDTGAVVCGCNVENVSYGLTLCAERVAIGAAVAQGHRKFVALAIVAEGRTLPFPCGACRQVLAEFCDPKLPVHVALADNMQTVRTASLGSLLPNAFGAGALAQNPG